MLLAPKDVAVLVRQTGAPRAEAVATLRRHGGDLVDALMDLEARPRPPAETKVHQHQKSPPPEMQRSPIAPTAPCPAPMVMEMPHVASVELTLVDRADGAVPRAVGTPPPGPLLRPPPPAPRRPGRRCGARLWSLLTFWLLCAGMLGVMLIPSNLGRWWTEGARDVRPWWHAYPAQVLAFSVTQVSAAALTVVFASPDRSISGRSSAALAGLALAAFVVVFAAPDFAYEDFQKAPALAFSSGGCIDPGPSSEELSPKLQELLLETCPTFATAGTSAHSLEDADFVSVAPKFTGHSLELLVASLANLKDSAPVIPKTVAPEMDALLKPQCVQPFINALCNTVLQRCSYLQCVPSTDGQACAYSGWMNAWADCGGSTPNTTRQVIDTSMRNILDRPEFHAFLAGDRMVVVTSLINTLIDSVGDAPDNEHGIVSVHPRHGNCSALWRTQMSSPSNATSRTPNASHADGEDDDGRVLGCNPRARTYSTSDPVLKFDSLHVFVFFFLVLSLFVFASS